MEIQEKEAFYEQCAEVLGMEHEFRQPPGRRTRWNNRRLGNGRFPGFGLVRIHGSMVMIIARSGSLTFASPDAAIEYLRNLPKPSQKA